MRRYMRRGMTGREKRRLLLFLVCAALIALAVTAMTQLRPITAVKSNMAEFNRLQSAVLADVLQRLSEVSTRELAIPLGSLTGSPLLAGRGPLLHIKMQSVGSSSAHFENAFASAGINQTRHEIRLVVDVYVSVLLPGFSTVTKVTNRCAVAETVIVGSVPDTYTYFDTREDMSSTAEDFIMNNAG